MTELVSQSGHEHFTEQERSVDTVIHLLQIDEGCVEGGGGSVEPGRLACWPQRYGLCLFFPWRRHLGRVWDMFASFMKCMSLVLRMLVNSLPKQLVILTFNALTLFMFTV